MVDEDLVRHTSDLVSTTRGVHALNGLALLERGSGGGLGVSCQYAFLKRVWLHLDLLSYLAAAVDGRVLANTVDLVAGRGVDNVVRLGSVARHDCEFW